MKDLNTRQEYIPSTFAEAMADGCDLVQPKYAGLWCRVEVLHGLAKVFDPQGEILTYVDIKSRDVACTLIGDLFGPPRHDVSTIVVWDCWEVGQVDTEYWRPEYTNLRSFAYRDRFAFVKQQIQQIGLPFVPVRCYRMSDAEKLWTAAAEDVCGLVYRRMKDSVMMPLRVARRYKELPGQLP